ncbi:MAG: hypothetical protein J6C62_00220 [Clostridia bacterium]|nr:hypothetical protein [Clostridia bacterium]
MRKNNTNHYSYKYFYKEYKLLHIILVAVLLVTLVVVIVCFSQCFTNFQILCEFSGWASLIAGIMTYLGSSFLGLLVFYNSWQRQKMEDANNKIIVNVDNKCSIDYSGNFVPYKLDQLPVKFGCWGAISTNKFDGNKTCDYIEFIITNYNEVPMFTKLIGVYYLNKKELEQISYVDFKAIKKDEQPLGFREENRYFIGVNRKVYDGNFKRLVYVFRFYNLKHDEQYCLYLLNMSQQSMNPLPIYISKDEYYKSMKEKNNPFGSYEDFMKLIDIKDLSNKGKRKAVKSR